MRHLRLFNWGVSHLLIMAQDHVELVLYILRLSVQIRNAWRPYLNVGCAWSRSIFTSFSFKHPQRISLPPVQARPMLPNRSLQVHHEYFSIENIVFDVSLQLTSHVSLLLSHDNQSLALYSFRAPNLHRSCVLKLPFRCILQFHLASSCCSSITKRLHAISSSSSLIPWSCDA